MANAINFQTRNPHPDLTAPAVTNSVPEQTWLRDLTDDQIRQGIVELSDSQRDEMIGHHFPAGNIRAGSVDEALRAAGADFEVAKVDLQPVIPGRPDMKLCQKSVGLYRTDTWKELGGCTKSYGVIQNHEAFAGAAALVKAGDAQISNVEVIDGGAKVRLACYMGASSLQRIGSTRPDTLAHFAMFEAAHGNGSAKGWLYTVNLACFNGMTSQSLAATYNVRHTSNGRDRVLEAQAKLLKIQEAAIEEVAIYADLAQRRMTLESFVEFAAELLDTTKEEVTDESDAKLIARRQKEIEELADYFQNSPGCVGQSAFDAYNAVTYKTTPRRDRFAKAETFASRFYGQQDGHAAGTKSKALRILTR